MQTQKSITAWVSRKPADGVKAKIIVHPFPSVITFVAAVTVWRRNAWEGLSSPRKPSSMYWVCPVWGLFRKHSRCHICSIRGFPFDCYMQSELTTCQLTRGAGCVALGGGDHTLRLLLLFSCPVMSVSLWPHGLQHARPPCPSPSPGACSNSRALSWWCHPTISSSVIPFSCPQSFLASGSFLMSKLFAAGGQSIGVSASTSVLPMNTQDWSPLGWTGWIFL